jgi:hypothetical protein
MSTVLMGGYTLRAEVTPYRRGAASGVRPEGRHYGYLVDSPKAQYWAQWR